MPVEIKELVIRVSAPENNNTGMPAPASAPQGGMSQQDLIEACVKQVLKILRQSKTR